MIEITYNPLDAKTVTAYVLHDSAGAVVTFIGTTRNETNDRKVLFLEYEAYRPMADEQLAKVKKEMFQRWKLTCVSIAHRLGRLDIGEPSLVVATSAPHRKDAYAASQYSIDRIKQIVPIWKKEFFENGAIWVGSQEEFNPLETQISGKQQTT